ncbi:MAG: fatty acid desaturase [Planctomycetes bacterium]|nr:fatty acid desaturase [Planctomycetota bacterium]
MSTASAIEQPRQPIPIRWYRSPVARDEMKRLMERSDTRALLQTLPHLLLMVASGTALYLALMQPAPWFGRWNPWLLLAVPPLLMLHGFLCSFAINAVHELGHGTVFRTRWLNSLFEHVFAFVGWIDHFSFTASHTRHHRYTLHYPDDQEVVLPTRCDHRGLWRNNGVFDWRVLWQYVNALRLRYRVAIGKAGFDGPWNAVLFPADQPELRRAPRRWAWCLLLGHGGVLVAAITFGWWALPLVVSLTPWYGGAIQMLMNSTQHVGMMKDVPDARLCCRTYTAHPVLQYFYWHMNYHIEHHMYAAVPCYRLGRLHRAILADLPPTPHGLRETWHQIDAIQEKQRLDPTFEQRPDLPAPVAVPTGIGQVDQDQDQDIAAA